MKIVFSFVLAIFPTLIFAQGSFGKSFCVGSSLTYIKHFEEIPGFRYYEYTWNINTAIQISKRLDIGVQALIIFMKPEGKISANHRIIGVFGQYNLLKREKIKLFAETSINTGDYKLSTNDFYPSYGKGIVYIGFGGGVELKISKKLPQLFLDLSFINYEQLKVENPYAYTQYIVGLNYRFGKGFKE